MICPNVISINTWLAGEMSPKCWSNKVTITESQLKSLFIEHKKDIERMTWKAMDPSEFSSSFLQFLTGLAKHTVRVNKVEMATALNRAKLTLSPAECDRWAEKVSNTIKFVKKKLRDAGSGKRLSPPILSLQRAWKKHAKKGAEKGPGASKKGASEKGASNSASEKGASKKGASEVTSADELMKTDIRSVLGLGPKITAEVDVVSSDGDLQDPTNNLNPPFTLANRSGVVL